MGGASAEVKGYIDVQLQITGTEVTLPLLVVSNFSFSILIGTDILRLHAATMSLGDDSAPLHLNTRVCDISLKQRTNINRSFWSSLTVACITDLIIIRPRTAAFVSVQVLRSLQNSQTVAVHPLGASILKFGCATIPAVCAPIDGVCRFAVVNPSNKSFLLRSHTPIAAVYLVNSIPNGTQIVARALRLSYEAKLRNVLS